MKTASPGPLRSPGGAVPRLSQAAPDSAKRVQHWLGISLGFAALCGAVLLGMAFRGEYIVQDDSRQHLFWMWRFVDPEAFPGDLLADYFQSVAPPGYSAVYWTMARLGVDPLTLGKLVPFGCLVVTAYFTYGAALRIFPVPPAACLASLFVTQVLAANDDVTSGSARAFVYPIFAAFLCFLAGGARARCLAALALLGLFYPQVMLVAVGMLWLRLVEWGPGFRLTRRGGEYLFAAAGLAVAAVVLLPFLQTTSGFGPVITAAAARGAPEFGPGGRSEFFTANPLQYWGYGDRSGLLPPTFHSPLLWAAVLLPFLLARKPRPALLEQTPFRGEILAQVAVASLALYFAAHTMLFRLHLPNRYTRHTFVFVIAIAAAVVLVSLWNALQTAAPGEEPRRDGRLRRFRRLAVFGFFFPFGLVPFWNTGYAAGPAPELYRFFARQPKETLVASLAEETENLPVFSRRAVLVSRECAIPYHLGFYRRFRERASDLLRAHYSPEAGELERVVERYGVDFVVVDRRAFRPEYLAERRWLQQFGAVYRESLQALRAGSEPALARVRKEAAVFETGSLVVLDAEKLLAAIRTAPRPSRPPRAGSPPRRAAEEAPAS